MTSRKNFPEKIEARRLRADARTSRQNDNVSLSADVETETFKKDESETKFKCQSTCRDVKMWSLFLGTTLVVTFARRLIDKSTLPELSITNFATDYFLNMVGIGVVYVFSTAAISRFHQFFLGAEYDNQEPTASDPKPSFYYLLIIILVISIIAVLGANLTLPDWPD